MDIAELIPHIEALIFASDKPVSALELTDLVNSAFGFMEEKVLLDQVETAVDGIREKYTSDFYPFEVMQSGGGWQFLTKRDYHKTIAQLNGDKFMKRLSAAALETLAIVAYKQPVTKGEIEAIRGVSADYAIQKLLEKELIIITGRNEKLPGHPLVYATSKSFMDYFGINSSDELPKIKEVLAEQLIEPTLVRKEGDLTEEDEDALLSVSENGELVEQDNVPINEQKSPEGIIEQENRGADEGFYQSEDEKSDKEGTALDDEKKQVTEENPGGIDESNEETDDEKRDEDEETDY